MTEAVDMMRSRASSMIDILPAEDVSRVVSFGNVALAETPFKPVTLDDVRKDLEISKQQAAAGQFKDFDDALDEISLKYGL